MTTMTTKRTRTMGGTTRQLGLMVAMEVKTKVGMLLVDLWGLEAVY
jgi:hypothetical protein